MRITNEINWISLQVEIHKTVFGIGLRKSPASDGMCIIFYKTYWTVVGEEVIKVVQSLFTEGKMRSTFNNTFIALILKLGCSIKVAHFWQISLCNVMYKIITKIIASTIQNQLKVIMHPSHMLDWSWSFWREREKTTFIFNYSIGDNVIINYELMIHLNPKKKKRKEGIYSFKVDLAKAYDRVE